MNYAINMHSCSMIYVPVFMKIGTGVQAILRFCFVNLRGRIVGITDERDSLCTISKWAQVE
jgi:hypothetical protein